MQTPPRLQEFLAAQGLGALVITRHANFAWLVGGRSYIGTGSEFGAALLLVNPAEMVVVANNIEAERLAAEELPPGLRVASYPWWEDGQPARLVRDLVGDVPLGADGPFPGARDVGAALAPLRWTLTPEQQALARRLGRDVAEAVEHTCRTLEPGETEHQVAARLAAALVARGVDPVVRLVAADGRAARWRHPLPTAARVERYALVAACGQRHGLVVSVTRLVHFGPPPADLLARHRACAQVDAALIQATRPGVAVADIFRVAQEAYAAAGYPEEWQHHHQGGLAGFASREYRATPTSPHTVAAGQMFAWNPTIAGVKSEDTILVLPEGNEVLTATGQWPQVQVGGMDRPAILVR